MLRSIEFIALAIRISSLDQVSESRAESYAQVLQPLAVARHFDPVTAVAMISVETGRSWRAGLVGGMHNQCIGLGQHCLHVYKYCTETEYQGARCQEKKQWLLNPHNNITKLAKDITRWRRYCRKLTGHPALFHRWLFGYQGHDWKDKTKQCGMKKTKRGWKDLPKPSLVRKVMRRRLDVIRATERRLRTKRRRG